MSDFKVKLSPTNTSFTLKNTTVSPTRLDTLNDVSEPDAAKVDGAILIYDADSDTYVLSQAVFESDGNGNYILKGGGF